MALVDAVATQRDRSVPWVPLRIATERCKGCELCIGTCPKGVLELDRAIVNHLGYHPVRLVSPEACTSCAFCARVCPDAVFTVLAAPRPRSSGRG
jgi:2-oxoglutarate ferredoxin oxidoreductase subunit delta